MTIQKDKVQHAVGGALVALATLAVLAVAAHLGIATAMLTAGVGAGIAFEVIQRLRKEGTPDWRDAAATAIGAATVALLWYINWPFLREALQ